MKGISKPALLLAVGIGGCQTVALAQTPFDHKLNCQLFGNMGTDVIDPKQGHSVVTSNFSCSVEGGPLDKGVATGHQVYEYNGTIGIGKAGMGVIRHPDGVSVWTNDQMKIELKMQDGKVAGFDSTGTGTNTLGTGAAKGMEGKRYTYVGRPTGLGRFVVETKYEDSK